MDPFLAVYQREIDTLHPAMEIGEMEETPEQQILGDLIDRVIALGIGLGISR